ncbi:hypothetical protein BV25DRAFT_1052783 [Artomyces pyxidatus]|uniref:Uncharacterized protein n=1 Tax=Artomyces pyxidatus TaxID=48021 RepID=A0ACB8SSZ9_9AGAM|nr:hypothetical protein BV25DRAFT_1052783 [Artomyces pyxidatus]
MTNPSPSTTIRLLPVSCLLPSHLPTSAAAEVRASEATRTCALHANNPFERQSATSCPLLIHLASI